jgi:hypothetical protein
VYSEQEGQGVIQAQRGGGCTATGQSTVEQRLQREQQEWQHSERDQHCVSINMRVFYFLVFGFTVPNLYGQIIVIVLLGL